MDMTNDPLHFAKISAGLCLNAKWNKLCHLDAYAAILWVNSLSFSALTLNDGYEPKEVVERLGGTEEQVEHIVQVGMGVSDGHGGFTVHDYEKYQLTRAEALKLHELRSKIGSKGAAKRWSKRINPRYINPDTGEEMAKPQKDEK